MDKKEVKEKREVSGVTLLILGVFAVALSASNIILHQPNAMFISPLNVALSVGFFDGGERKRIIGWIWAMTAVFNFTSGILQLV